jgi:RNA polymerase sigma-70 factor (ECF subfamily)
MKVMIGARRGQARDGLILKAGYNFRIAGINVDLNDLDDAALLQLVQGGDENALGQIYDRYGRLVYSLAFNVLGDAALAEETTQEVFLRVWRKADTFDPRQGKVVAWLAGIARHRAIDIIRAQSKRPEGNLSVWAVEDILGLKDPEDVEEAAEAAQRQERVRRALAGLPESQRQALAYAYFQGYSHSQIAAALNEPLGTVKTRIRLAMHKLRELLSEEMASKDQ